METCYADATGNCCPKVPGHYSGQDCCMDCANLGSKCCAHDPRCEVHRKQDDSAAKARALTAALYGEEDDDRDPKGAADTMTADRLPYGKKELGEPPLPCCDHMEDEHDPAGCNREGCACGNQAYTARKQAMDDLAVGKAVAIEVEP